MPPVAIAALSVSDLARAFRRARSNKRREDIIRDLARRTEYGAKTVFCKATGLDYRTCMRRLQVLRGPDADGAAARKARSQQRAAMVFRVRDKLIATTEGPHACSSRRICKRLRTERLPNGPTPPRRRSIELFIKRRRAALRAKNCLA